MSEPTVHATQPWVAQTLAGIDYGRPQNPEPVTGTLQAAGSVVMLPFPEVSDLSSFSFHVLGFTTGTFTLERTLHADPTTAPQSAWTTVGAFKAGTRTSKGVWTDSPGAYHGNCSASSAVRIRVTGALDAPAAVRIIAGSGTGTITIGAIASNEGNIIGAVQMLAQHYSSATGGRVSFNASTGLLPLSGNQVLELAALVNPAGSGVDLQVEALVPGADVAVSIQRYRLPATAITVTGTAQTTVNRGGGANAGKGRLYRNGQYTRAGGTESKVDFVNARTERDPVAGGIVLRPGEALAWAIRLAGGAANATWQGTFEAVWWELAAAA